MPETKPREQFGCVVAFGIASLVTVVAFLVFKGAGCDERQLNAICLAAGLVSLIVVGALWR